MVYVEVRVGAEWCQIGPFGSLDEAQKETDLGLRDIEWIEEYRFVDESGELIA